MVASGLLGVNIGRCIIQHLMQLCLRLSAWTALLAWGWQYPNVCVFVVCMLACIVQAQTEHKLVPESFQEMP